jgi:putative addiction module component (TIGR02574 family)
MRRSSRLPLASFALAAVFLAGCPDNAGNAPPADHLFYPIAAVVAGPDARPFLYVVNSNFDLKYNGSTVVAIDLAPLRARAAAPANCDPDPDSTVGAQVCRDSEFIMPPTLEQLGLDTLSAADRLAVAEAIWESVAREAEQAPVPDAQRQALERRLADSLARPDAVVPWEVVKARALARATR